MTDIDITKRFGPDKRKIKPQLEESSSLNMGMEAEDTGIETAVNVEEQEKNEGIKILIMAIYTALCQISHHRIHIGQSFRNQHSLNNFLFSHKTSFF